jgi:DNA polymerase-1
MPAFEAGRAVSVRDRLKPVPRLPLLVVDGDSLAHRAYHGLPKTIVRAEGRPSGAIVGFTNMLVRLWEAEFPRAVLVGWDTLEVPTYRHEAFAGYQGGREFDEALLEQLELLPQLVDALGFAVAKAPGYEADDFLAAAAAQEEARGGSVLVATSDRDAFQLASERTTILQPVRGVSELARIRPAEVRERYGVEPEQVPDFIALRGDPSDRLPGARGVGPKTAASLLAEYGSLEALLAAGRFSAEQEELRLYRRIAALDASAPLPSLADQTPTWAEASSLLRSWGMNVVADRLDRSTS